MNVSFGLDVDARCTTCGAERDIPIGTAKRVLEADRLYADVDDSCGGCGATRIAVKVTIDDGSEEAHATDGGRPNRSRR